MKRGLLILPLVLLGCASPSRHVERPGAPALVPIHEDYVQTASASALVFDPPIIRGLPELNLSREGREPEAFWGYDSGTTTSYYLRSDDRQFDDSLDGIHRRAITERVGVSFR